LFRSIIETQHVQYVQVKLKQTGELQVLNVSEDFFSLNDLVVMEYHHVKNVQVFFKFAVNNELGSQI